MLESVLADVLTRVLGQYLEGIDRDNVRFGAWSGLVELRGVALRPEALAVLFETLGMHLPVTVEAGFIGLLRLQVPWKTIGSTPVQIHMHDITIIARPVRGDGSDDSELRTRERRIKRAKLATDDAVREASWGVANDKSTSQSWSNWLVSEDLRAKIIDNIQVHLSDISLRFEDPFSDPRRPYIASIICKSLKAVSANAQWIEAFVERTAESSFSSARKLLEVKGFHIDWAPITPRDAPGLSRGTNSSADDEHRFETLELLKQFMAADGITNDSTDTVNGVKSLLRPVDGAMRLRLSTGTSHGSPSNRAEKEPSVDLDIRFPDVVLELDDVQYACLLQTSVYFARLATRGFRPKTPRERWKWAIDQMLPGFSARREQVLQMTEEGILKARDKRLVYAAYRKSILKSRRMAVEEPKHIAADLEELEDSLSHEEVLAMRDFVDRQIEVEGENWQPASSNASSPKEIQKEGTTMGSFWGMLGYSEANSITESQLAKDEELDIADAATQDIPDDSVPSVADCEAQSGARSIILRVAFLLRGASVRLSQKGFPSTSIPRVSLNLHDLRAGVLYDSDGKLTVEAVLGSIEAWDMLNGKRMVYSRLSAFSGSEYDALSQALESSYPQDVTEAIEMIRRGSNPAKELLAHEEEYSGTGEEPVHPPGRQYFGDLDGSTKSQMLEESGGERQFSRNRPRNNSNSRESTPSTCRVTESEFLGTSKQISGAQKYVAAFRYVQAIPDATESSTIARSKLEISVATIEAIVDGPKGSFVWGLKFWQPKGMAQDPIMAFLGAAAGARIAELRMELEEVLLANKVPMQINAVILAPRFIFPSASEASPAIVVNMGILGICTSDNSSEAQSSRDQRTARLRYSSYVLTLDDLGMYFSPVLPTAVSQELRNSSNMLSTNRFSLGFTEQSSIDTANVERIIQPFSLRFILQTLRDVNVVQVAHTPLRNPEADASSIAKVRLRGNIPGLHLIVTQKSLQHLIVETRRWGSEMRPQSGVPIPAFFDASGRDGWQPLRVEDESTLMDYENSNILEHRNEEKLESAHIQESSPPTTMASYDLKIMVHNVSVEVRDTMEVRLVTAVASGMGTKIVKTGRTKLQADFSLRSWSVTDGSRGSTAAFKRLVYAGTFTRSKGVSPPRSTSGASDEVSHDSKNEKNFVSIQYILDLAGNEQTVRFRFLSLNMVCVRETYVKLASFFYNVHKCASGKFRDPSLDAPQQRAGTNLQSAPSVVQSPSQARHDSTNAVLEAVRSKISVVAEFDGFNFQLVASGGAIALIEMKDSNIHFERNEKGQMKAWGDFQSFSIRDWTAPISEHAAVVTYEKPSEAMACMMNTRDKSLVSSNEHGDQWTLSIPMSQHQNYCFKARFKGIKVCFLYRFSVVLQQYFSVLQDGVQPAVDAVMEQVQGGDHEMEEKEIHKSPSKALGRRSVVLADLHLTDLEIRSPRHSGCATEALTLLFSRVHIANMEDVASQTKWRTSFDGVDFAVDYVLPQSGTAAKPSSVSSSFLRNFSAEMVLRYRSPQETLQAEHMPGTGLLVDLKVSKDIMIELSEAQYSVLYFVLTENLVETISGSEISADVTTIVPIVSAQSRSDSPPMGVAGQFVESDQGESFNEIALPPVKAEARRIVFDMNVSVPSLNLEVSRGWDVRQTECKVLGIYMGNVKLDFTYRKPSHIFFEVVGKLLSVADLRKSNESLPFVAPLSSLNQASAEHSQKENITATYEKETGCPASIVVFLGGLQTQVVPELFRDLSFLAVPGWPYLESSTFAPDFVYLGRNMTVVLSQSQIVLFSEEEEKDRRAVVLTGEFELKMDWLRGTGAKRLSLRSTQVEMSTVSTFPQLKRNASDNNGNIHAYDAIPVNRRETPLLYPNDSFIEYVGPEVDDMGCRLDISVDSILCLINAADISLLRAVLSRPKRMTSSYLASRQWKQASAVPGSQDANTNVPTPKQQRSKKAKENMALAINVPAARYLITDERNGRFIPILETRFKSVSVNAHMGSMFQMEGEIAMDLFNTTQGWWEPALESWCLAASISQGLSGSRAIVLKSEKRLNVNITPTTVTAAITVANSLRNAAVAGRKDSPEAPAVQKAQDDGEHRRFHESRDLTSDRRPSVAAFLIRNELGLPISMGLNGRPGRRTIVHNSEVEVGVQTEHLVSSLHTGQSRSRANVLKCFITIPRFTAQELSAAETGKHCVTFFPEVNLSAPQDERTNPARDEVDPLHLVWEVKMVNGVPFCTIRSPYRIINDTKSTLAVIVRNERQQTSNSMEGLQVSLKPGGHLSLPILESRQIVHVRPLNIGLSTDRDNEGMNGQSSLLNTMFEWSSSLPSFSWLYQNAREAAGPHSGKQRHVTSSGPQSPQRNYPVLRCRSAQSDLHDFYIAVAVRCPLHLSENTSAIPTWVDVSLCAPIILENKLPGNLSYRITQRYTLPSVGALAIPEGEGAVLAAGVISPLRESHLHFSGESLGSTFLSFAYENSIETAGSISRISSDVPSRFGPEISFGDIRTKKAGVVLPSAKRTVDPRGQPRRDFRATVRPAKRDGFQLEVFSGFWIRNRSDTPVEVCSRSSYYGAGSQRCFLSSRPPSKSPNAFVCLEGPYLSVRCANEANSRPSDELMDQSDWWTSPSMLEDITKPLSLTIAGRSLEIELRPAIGLESCTSIITIRNSSWICNNTLSILQWCQASVVDSNGNCRTRFLNTLQPTEVQGIHWDAKSSSRAVRLRLASDGGQSDWIWSPPVPLDIGHSRELPAKMYRPKTHEQYIARVASKNISGNAMALVVYGEDRHHPPYRIVNLCKERAIAFSQIGSHERPWLVRAGKTSRYSWDDPLAPPNERVLSLRILEKNELSLKAGEGIAASSSQASISHRHEDCTLNIDVVGDRVMVLSDSYEPTLVVSVSVDGATKIVTFSEEDKNGRLLVTTDRTAIERAATGETAPDPVLTVGWEDIGHKSNARKTESSGDVSVTVSPVLFDYPASENMIPIPDRSKRKQVDTDAALFLESVGISIVSKEPAELLYICFKGVLVNYEAYSKLECLALHIRDFQVDNQLIRTAYPVLMWISPASLKAPNTEGGWSDHMNDDNAIALEVHRQVTDDDILMVKTFQGAIRPFNVSFEDDLVSQILTFLSDTSIMGHGTSQEPLSGFDIEQKEFEHGVRGIKAGKTNDGEQLMGTESRRTGIPTSRRIYVHEFRILKTSMRLTSSGSGSAIAKAAGVNASARALVALVLNVENCEFSLPSLEVQNVFDSLHHFSALVKEYYGTQLSNQRMKLLASNAFVGNPAALFDAVGTGARDFFTEPGKAKGSADFIAKVGRGSKSLLTHTVGGLVQSVSSIPRAVSTSLENAVGDNEYLAERERIRGSNLAGGHRGSSVKNPAQGLATGAVSFAHGISSGVTGFIREPVQGAKQGGAGGFFKGIGKAFIGGVAKPVAGAIDLVTEPAAGLSRQIANAEQSFAGRKDISVPERPPRAFRGRNQRLDSFDRRYAVGVCLYKAIQLASGITYDSELLDWIELSDRADRSSIDGDVWIWNILQKYARSMPGTKKQVRAEQKNMSGGASRSVSFQSRPEKTRIALICKTDVVIVSLDCKFITSIPLWNDCVYRISGQGKEAVVYINLRGGQESSPRQAESTFFTGSLMSAPWDAPSAGKRRRPKVGEELIDRIDCGSANARDDLVQCLRSLTKEMTEANYSRSARANLRRESSSGVELVSMSASHDENWQELRPRGGSSSDNARDGFLPFFGSAVTTQSERVNRPAQSSKRRESDSSNAYRPGSASQPRTKTPSNLEKRIRRLSTATHSYGGLETKANLRVIVANEINGAHRLALMSGSIERGNWKIEPPLHIATLEAELFVADCGREAFGSVVYGIEYMTRTGSGRVRDSDGKPSQVVIDFFDDGNSSMSFTTQASEGFRVAFEQKLGGQDTAVFVVREMDQVVRLPDPTSTPQPERQQFSGDEAKTTSPGPSSGGGNITMSADELSLKQLMDIGFRFEDAVGALAEAGGDLVKAVDILTR